VGESRHAVLFRIRHHLAYRVPSGLELKDDLDIHSGRQEIRQRIVRKIYPSLSLLSGHVFSTSVDDCGDESQRILVPPTFLVKVKKLSIQMNQHREFAIVSAFGHFRADFDGKLLLIGLGDHCFSDSLSLLGIGISGCAGLRLRLG
jgi:hypothetical protein